MEFARKNWRGKPRLLPIREERVFDLAPKLPHFWMTSAAAADRNDNDLSLRDVSAGSTWVIVCSFLGDDQSASRSREPLSQ